MINRRAALLSGLAAAALPSSSWAARQAGDPRVQTVAGPVMGLREDEISVFKGVRYGAPTRRFQPPEPPAPASALLLGSTSP